MFESVTERGNTMKFLKEDGKIEEGVALSERQVEQRQKIEDFLHAKVCSGYHSFYGSSAKCAFLANQLIVKMNALTTAGLEHVIDGLMPKPEPEPVPEIAPPIWKLPQPALLVWVRC